MSALPPTNFASSPSFCSAKCGWRRQHYDPARLDETRRGESQLQPFDTSQPPRLDSVYLEMRPSKFQRQVNFITRPNGCQYLPTNPARLVTQQRLRVGRKPVRRCILSPWDLPTGGRDPFAAGSFWPVFRFCCSWQAWRSRAAKTEGNYRRRTPLLMRTPSPRRRKASVASPGMFELTKPFRMG